jgi:hypothetical protein
MSIKQYCNVFVDKEALDTLIGKTKVIEKKISSLLK